MCYLKYLHIPNLETLIYCSENAIPLLLRPKYMGILADYMQQIKTVQSEKCVVIFGRVRISLRYSRENLKKSWLPCPFQGLSLPY